MVRTKNTNTGRKLRLRKSCNENNLVLLQIRLRIRLISLLERKRDLINERREQLKQLAPLLRKPCRCSNCKGHSETNSSLLQCAECQLFFHGECIGFSKSNRYRTVTCSVHKVEKDMREEYMASSLYKEGFKVVKGHLNEKQVSDMLSNVKALERNKRRIFNNKDGPNDGLRWQANMSPEMVGKLRLGNVLRMEELAKELRPHRPGEDFYTKLTVLFSDRGCQQQQAHTDYPPEDSLGGDFRTPLSMIFALEDGTGLETWDRPGGTQRRLELSAGDVVVCAAHLVHAGSSYESPNTRLHVTVGTKLHPGSTRRTFRV